MEASFVRVEWKAKESTEKCSQGEMPFLGEVREMQRVPAAVFSRASFNGCLSEAVRHCGRDDQEIADAIHISPGYMSRFMRGVGQQWAKRLVAFMRETQSIAPLQWLADQMGCDVVPRAAQQARIRQLEAELEAARRSA